MMAEEANLFLRSRHVEKGSSSYQNYLRPRRREKRILCKTSALFSRLLHYIILSIIFTRFSLVSLSLIEPPLIMTTKLLRFGAVRRGEEHPNRLGRICGGCSATKSFFSRSLHPRSTYFPTKFSSTELLPADWPPTTAICGRSSCMCTPNEVNASCNLFTIGISASIPTFVVDIFSSFASYSFLRRF